ncbi:MAG: DnaA ATPase domain-containing protein [Metamycoplasmataceae bacterium]
MENKSSSLKDNNFSNKLFLNFLEKKLGDEVLFSLFFRDLDCYLRDNFLIIVTKNEDTLRYLKKNYQNMIFQAAKDLFPSIEDIIIDQKGKDNFFEKIRVNKVKEEGLNKKLTIDVYIQGEFNQDIFRAAKKISKSDGIIYSPFFIYGKSGFGKTHFLHAMGNILYGKNQSVKYISANDFTNSFLTLISGNDPKQTNNFIEDFKQFDVLLFDDIQQYSNKNATLGALFNLINYFIENNKQIFICSDREPDLLGGFEDRFITRFQGGLTFEIKYPSEKDYLKILKSKLIEKQFDISKWEKETLDFIVRNYSTSIRSLEGAINKILFEVSDYKNDQIYTLERIKEIFKSVPFNNENITPDKILKTVAAYYNVSVSSITSKTRSAKIVTARDMAVFLLREKLNLKLQEIGKILGGKDHSSIFSCLNRFISKKSVDPSIDLAIKRIIKDLKKNY